ncbi:uncharacterized protein N7515_001208 [Penicillium bovifimosum]|uniref:Uncharacterized protein n=1 Tax=Penicillium bovifimosum TaxID=126998 RepID=A0A9W9HHJ0_9EURO|nr:uncharacterized protein N7515_001208 [Penicillium bovifimosum]KAJ5146644.1 hypothetical protein N7515_001208 [Penicillium bovifimosum]
MILPSVEDRLEEDVPEAPQGSENADTLSEAIIHSLPETDSHSTTEGFHDVFTNEECRMMLEAAVEEQVLPREEDLESEVVVDLTNIPCEEAEERSPDPPRPQPSIEMPPPRPSGIQTSPDIVFETVDVPHIETPMDEFHLLLAVWLDDARITRQQYASLVQILQTSKMQSIQELPLDINTLKRNLRGQMSQLPVISRKIPVIPSQLPTLSPNQRHLNQQYMKNLYIIDPIPLITRLLHSPMFQSHMYKGLAELVPRAGELWQSLSWASSIRSTSGEFAQYPDHSPIFPSDIVRYRCRSRECCVAGRPPFMPHLGRVRGVYKQENIKVLGTQSIRQPGDLLPPIDSQDPPFESFELILLEDDEVLLTEDEVLGREPDVFHDRQFKIVPGMIVRRPPSSTFTICRVYKKSGNTVRALQQTHAIRGELEIAQYGRQHLVDTLSSQRCVSVPYQTFMDGFGLYRTMYRSIMGVYMIPSCVPVAERAKRSNVLPITLGPHGSNFPEVVGSLTHLRRLEEGVDITWTDGRPIRLVAGCIAYIGDMPQQNDNAGCKRPHANRGCRTCLITEEVRDDFQFDIETFGRYHFQVQDQRRTATSQPPTARAKMFKELGLVKDPSPLLQICPALDVVTHFPSDICHS